MPPTPPQPGETALKGGATAGDSRTALEKVALAALSPALSDCRSQGYKVQSALFLANGEFLQCL